MVEDFRTYGCAMAVYSDTDKVHTCVAHTVEGGHHLCFVAPSSKPWILWSRGSVEWCVAYSIYKPDAGRVPPGETVGDFLFAAVYDSIRAKVTRDIARRIVDSEWLSQAVHTAVRLGEAEGRRQERDRICDLVDDKLHMHIRKLDGVMPD